MTMLPRVQIHADESCLGNQFVGQNRPGGAAALIEHWDGEAWARRDIWTSEGSTTNNRMAISSAILALEALTERCRVRFVSDSTYLVDGAAKWLPAWKRKGWRRKGGPIKNLGLWRRLDEVMATHVIEWVWVRGHAGDPRNEYVDRLAQSAARELTASRKPVPSKFVEWLNQEREEHDRYWEFFEFSPPDA